LEFETHVVHPDVETDFSNSDIDPRLDVPWKGPSKDMLYVKVALHVENHEVGEDEGILDSHQ
jgi:hypothetical protein